MSLPAIKARLCAETDTQAEARRLKYLTPGAGQAQEYREVFEEAQKAVGDPDADAAPIPDPYRLLRAGIGAETDPTAGKPVATISEAARRVLAAADKKAAWLPRGSLSGTAAMRARKVGR